ncbi:hypothetical protein LAM01_14730 [Amylolactobacillus amylophilus]|nr:hypothetical protein LAM01_14730 [Amylolactobacillus amylophilus]
MIVTRIWEYLYMVVGYLVPIAVLVYSVKRTKYQAKTRVSRLNEQRLTAHSRFFIVLLLLAWLALTYVVVF